MSIVITILVFILVFSVVVIVHEFGHFIVAKRSGIKVEEFGIGFPPRIWSKKKGDTVYSVNAIPFGGFVRLLGMDEAKKSAKKNPKNFSDRSMRTRAKVMVAGVVMNLILAWTLLSVGFTFGMQPLLVVDDVFSAVDSGMVVLQEGAYVSSVKDDGPASEAGVMAGDVLIEFNGRSVNDFSLMKEILVNPFGEYVFARGEESFSVLFEDPQVDAQVDPQVDADEMPTFGVVFADTIYFPRVKIHTVDVSSNAYKGGLRSGDVLVAINGKQINSLSQFKLISEGLDEAMMTVFRDGVRKDLLIDLDPYRSVIISGVVDGGFAHKAGLSDGDVVLSINGRMISGIEDFISYVGGVEDGVLAFSFERKGEVLFKEVQVEGGKVGVYLSELFSGESGDFSVYNVDQFTSVVEIKDEKYPFYEAPFHAFSETWRMTKLTGVFFVGFLEKLVKTGEVSENIAGPVGIAKMTGIFAREGIIPLIRFMALLSISLAVLNILPFPALDGGKLMFIFIEFVMRKKVPSKWENYIHLLGYLLIIALVIGLSYRDVLNWASA